MRPYMLIPIAAFLGLAACNDGQDVAQTEPEAPVTQPADTAAAPPPPPAATETAPAQDVAEAPVGSPVVTPSPAPTSPTPAQEMAATPQAVDETGAIGRDMMIPPGEYQSQSVSLNLQQDGTFMLRNPATGDQAEGQYQQEGTFLTLMTEEQPEPMVCEVVPEGDAFTLMATDPSCEPLDGQTFRQAG